MHVFEFTIICYKTTFQTKAIYFSNTSKSHVLSVEGGQTAQVDLVRSAEGFGGWLPAGIGGRLTTDVCC